MKIDGSYAMYLQLVTIIVRKNNENSLPLSSVISFFYFTLKPRSSKFLFKSIFWVDGAAEKKTDSRSLSGFPFKQLLWHYANRLDNHYYFMA